MCQILFWCNSQVCWWAAFTATRKGSYLAPYKCTMLTLLILHSCCKLDNCSRLPILQKMQTAVSQGPLSPKIQCQPRSTVRHSPLPARVCCQPGSAASQGPLSARVCCQPGSAISEGSLLVRIRCQPGSTVRHCYHWRCCFKTCQGPLQLGSEVSMPERSVFQKEAERRHHTEVKFVGLEDKVRNLGEMHRLAVWHFVVSFKDSHHAACKTVEGQMLVPASSPWNVAEKRREGAAGESTRPFLSRAAETAGADSQRQCPANPFAAQILTYFL